MLVYSLESPHRSDFNEYFQHKLLSRKIENISLNYRFFFCFFLLPDLAP